MGDRYIIKVVCPVCGAVDDDVYYAPTCGFLDWRCECGHVVDLESYTGISYEEASNAAEIKELVKMLAEKAKGLTRWQGEVCARCHRRNVVGFNVTDVAWILVTDGTEDVWCPQCFDEEAERRGIEYQFTGIWPVTWSDWND